MVLILTVFGLIVSKVHSLSQMWLSQDKGEKNMNNTLTRSLLLVSFKQSERARKLCDPVQISMYQLESDCRGAGHGPTQSTHTIDPTST